MTGKREKLFQVKAIKLECEGYETSKRVSKKFDRTTLNKVIITVTINQAYGKIIIPIIVNKSKCFTQSASVTPEVLLNQLRAQVRELPLPTPLFWPLATLLPIFHACSEFVLSL